MLFIENKYTVWYFKIINNRTTNTVNGYTEKHHIVPKSLGGSDDTLNLVRLTPREHYICHLLLIRMTSGSSKVKMVHAASSYSYWTTKNHNRKFKLNSRTVNQLKIARQQHLKVEMNKPKNLLRSSEAARKLWDNPEHRILQSEKRKQLWEDPDYLIKMKNRKRPFKRVIVEGIEYQSLREAASQLKLDPSTISKRCSSKHDKFVNWNYI